MAHKWTENDEILALYVYCQIPFKKATDTNPLIVEIAELMGLKPSTVKMKVGNFGSFDPLLKNQGKKGLENTTALDEEIWKKYYGHWDKLISDAELIITNLRKGKNVKRNELPQGLDSLVMTKHRLNQSFFRSAVLSSYNNTCCITGITNPLLLEACHIIAWSEDENLRTNPMNGLCLSPTFHKAYDEFLISITPDYILKISESFIESASEPSFKAYLRLKNNSKIILPNRFMPDKDYLQKHYDIFIEKNNEDRKQ